MKKIKKEKQRIKTIIKKHTKLVIGFIIGISIPMGVYGTILFASNEVSYDNATSGLNSSNVQDAIDEIKTVVDSC